jgi:thiamine pyrophosphate-dependent acetolactate synthase large subunit-like protein
VIYTSLDQALHNGAHMIFQATPTADLYIAAGAEAVVSDLLEALGPSAKKEPWRAAVRRTPKPVTPDRISVEMIATTLRASIKDHDNYSLAALCRGWPCDAWPFHNPSAYLGKDGGGGIGSGGALSIGAALGNLSLGKKTISVLGDGDFMMGGNSIWTAVKHKIPLMIIINNNQSYFNDELHQEVVAKRRNRPVGNRWIGQAISDPGLDIAKFVEAQGAIGIGPIKTQAELQAAIKRGLEILDAGGICLLDVHVPPGEDRRDASSTGVRNT